MDSQATKKLDRLRAAHLSQAGGQEALDIVRESLHSYVVFYGSGKGWETMKQAPARFASSAAESAARPVAKRP